MSITNVLPFPGTVLGAGHERMQSNMPTADQLIIELQETLDLMPIEASEKVLLLARVKAIAMRSYLYGARYGEAFNGTTLRITTAPG